jgi:hypothetical protein
MTVGQLIDSDPGEIRPAQVLVPIERAKQDRGIALREREDPVALVVIEPDTLLIQNLDGQDREFFLEAGLELGETLKIGSPESVRRYAMRQDGSYYGAHLEKVFQERREAALKAMDDPGRQQAAQAATTSGYWLAEFAVPQRPS